MTRHDDEPGDRPTPADCLVIVCGVAAVVIGAWSLLVAVTASFAALAPEVANDWGAAPVFDILGGDRPAEITFLYLAYRGVAGAALLTAAVWLLRRQRRGHSAVRFLLAMDVFLFLALLLIWSARSIHPPYEAFVIELGMVILRILVLMVLAHPRTCRTLTRHPFSGPETNP